jgi:hypothetical protein
MANRRVFWACKRAGVAPLGSASYTTIRGLQSLNLTTTFNLQQAFELGQLEIYENIEGIPDIEATMEKVLDGYAPIYTLLTQQGTAATLVGRSAARASLALEIYPDTNTSATGTGDSAVELSGLYVSAVGYQATLNDSAKESVTCVGNNKVWVGGGSVAFADDPFADNDDTPQAITGSGGVQRREDVLFGAGGTLLPTEIYGIASDGTNVLTDSEYGCHVQSININTNLGREDLFELGRKANYFRYVRFPVQVNSAITVTSASGDMISATEEGLYSEGGSCGRYNLTDQQIVLKMCEGLIVDAGKKNKLQSVNVAGGDTGGGNEEITFNYQGWNHFSVFHPEDPNAGDADFTYS